MKSTLPPEVQATIPNTTWGRILSSTPVVMTVVATLLAGLASSEMTHAQYDRSMASQQQSKAGDQWAFFQAKRLRALIQQGTLDALEFSAPPTREGSALNTVLKGLPGNETKDTQPHPEIDALTSGQVPEVASAQLDPPLQAALSAIARQRPEAEITPLVIGVSDVSVAAGMIQAIAAVARFDEALQPVLQGIDRLQHAALDASDTFSVAASSSGPTGPSHTVKQDLVAARLRFTIHRYEAEARLNQTIASLYEVLVRKSNLSADRHYARSQRFFYGMLAAQLSVIMSTFATAVRMRNTLWTLAAVAGLFAVALAAYVYLVE